VKTRTLVITALITVAVAIVLSYRTWLQPQSTTMEPTASPTVPPPPSADEATRTITTSDSQVIAAIEARDMDALSRFVHPTKGVRISHYTYVRPDSDVVFTASGLRQGWGSPREHFWGEADGTGDPIRMTLRAYLEKYYSRNFSKAPRVGVNAPAIGTGNALNNIADIYPRAIIVEHHFPGFDEQYGGMDWQSLWLMYEQDAEAWYLVGIARGFWTI
jgi:hypothetical protein